MECKIQKKQSKLKKIFSRSGYFSREIIFLITAFVYILPVYIIAINGFKTEFEVNQSLIRLPSGFYFDNFVKVFREMNYLQSLFNTLMIAGFTLLFLVFFSSMAAFPLAKKVTWINKKIYGYFLMGIIVPSAMTLVPLYQLLRSFSLINNRMGLVVIYVAGSLPYAIFFYVGFMMSIPGEMEESAIIDGCGPFRAFWLIIFPMLKNATVIICILNLLGYWNDFLYPLVFLQQNSKRTLMVQIFMFRGRYTTDWAYLFAGMLLVTLPFLIIFIFSQKQIIKGIASGAIKS